MLETRDLSLALPDFTRKRPFQKAPLVEILNGVTLSLAKGETLGIVGESGSGKTSLGRTLVRLYRPTGGRLLFDGMDITEMEESELRPLRSRFQMIFQDPRSSLNPRRKVGDRIAQPLLIYGLAASRREANRRVDELLERVGLSSAHANRYPHELSGGQRQRIGIARAIALKPDLVVADEIVSGLDVSSQAQILALLRELRADMGLALIFITHDLSVIRTVCDRVMVMMSGAVVEEGQCADIFAAPKHDYTKKLLDAIPLPDVDPDWTKTTALTETGESLRMDIKGSVALVTGANRGVGEAFVTALLERGAKKVYASARDIASISAGERVEALGLDVTNEADVQAAAAKCADLTLLINNAGVNHNRPLLGQPDTAKAEEEMAVNYFGTLAMCRAFAPVLKANDGGAIINMLSILGRVNLPMIGSYCASKAAGLSLTQAVRGELTAQRTIVVAVMPGAIDTRMSEQLPPPKEAPADIANAALDAVEAGEEDIYPGGMAQGVSQGLANDPKAVEKEFAAFGSE